MKKFLVSVICLPMAFGVTAQLAQGSVASSNSPGGVTYFYQYKPPHYNTTTGLLPLIISLHGVGQAGNANGSELINVLGDGIPVLLSEGKQLEFTWQGITEGFVFLAPQTDRGPVNDWPTYYVDEMIAYGIANLRVDPARIFLTGFSAGGGGVWKYATSSTTAASKLAGIAPASSSDMGTNFCNIASSKVAVWTFHGGSDGVIPSPTDHFKAVAVNGCSPIIPAVDTIIANESHNIYNSVAYDLTNTSHYPNVFQWMLKVNRNIDVDNDAVPVPVVTGSLSYTFAEPLKAKDFPFLDGSGSTDADDIIMDYLWYQTGGPAVNLPTSIRPSTVVADPSNNIGMAPGNYTFLFRVKDYLTSKVNNKGSHTQFASVSVTVTMASGHAAPATDAGGTVTYDVNRTSQGFIGRAQAYGCPGNVGCFTGYNWVQLPRNADPNLDGGPPVSLFAFGSSSTPYSTGAGEVNIANVTQAGTYRFQYSATNQFGETGSDILTITKLTALLPVNYAYFNGENDGNKNVLSWATTSELNSARFDVQRSIDGVNFTVAGAVTAKGGAVLTTYTFDDNNAIPGLTYYRLSQVDKDGKSTLSKTISINNRKTGLYIEQYPNPAHDNLTITIQGNTNGVMHIIIADMQGKAIIQQQWQKDQSLLKKVVNVGALQNGVYQMIVTVGQDKQVSSFVKY
jgi:predicted esterase